MTLIQLCPGPVVVGDLGAGQKVFSFTFVFVDPLKITLPSSGPLAVIGYFGVGQKNAASLHSCPSIGPTIVSTSPGPIVVIGYVGTGRKKETTRSCSSTPPAIVAPSPDVIIIIGNLGAGKIKNLYTSAHLHPAILLATSR